jgi:hypothetical protein
MRGDIEASGRAERGVERCYGLVWQFMRCWCRNGLLCLGVWSLGRVLHLRGHRNVEEAAQYQQAEESVRNVLKHYCLPKTPAVLFSYPPPARRSDLPPSHGEVSMSVSTGNRSLVPVAGSSAGDAI